jgi:hypothetical protein
MKKLIASAIALVTTVAAFAQAPAPNTSFSYTAGWDFKSKQPIATVNYSLTVLPNTFGIKNLNLNGVGFGGSSLGTNGLVGGAGIGLSGKIGKLTGVVGLGEGLFAGSTPHFLAFAGISGSL